MKLKTLTTTLALTALLAFAAAPALANEINQDTLDGKGTAELRAQVDPTYTVVIPASMTEDQSLKGGVNAIGNIKTTRLNLEPGTRLTCALTGDTLTRQNSSETIAYNAYYGTDKTAKTITLDETTDTAVNVDVDNNHIAAARAGTYKGTLTFTLSIVE